MADKKQVIGRNTMVEFIGYVKDVPAKVDTGADSSSVWVSDVRVDKHGVLRFSLFGKESPFYTGKTIKRDSYKVAQVRSASGHRQIRYRTQFTIRVGGKRVRALFNLSDRSLNQYPVLVGRRTLSGKFLVDVTESSYTEPRKSNTEVLNKKLTKNPHEFYKKHYKKSGVSLRSKS